MYKNTAFRTPEVMYSYDPDGKGRNLTIESFSTVSNRRSTFLKLNQRHTVKLTPLWSEHMGHVASAKKSNPWWDLGDAVAHAGLPNTSENSIAFLLKGMPSTIIVYQLQFRIRRLGQKYA